MWIFESFQQPLFKTELKNSNSLLQTFGMFRYSFLHPKFAQKLEKRIKWPLLPAKAVKTAKHMHFPVIFLKKFCSQFVLENVCVLTYSDWRKNAITASNSTVLSHIVPADWTTQNKSSNYSKNRWNCAKTCDFWRNFGAIFFYTKTFCSDVFCLT